MLVYLLHEKSYGSLGFNGFLQELIAKLQNMGIEIGRVIIYNKYIYVTRTYWNKTGFR